MLSIEELHDKLKRKEMSCVELIEQFLQRVETVQPVLNPFITILTERAREHAKLADKMFAGGRETLLTGIPFAVKDNYCIAGTRTTAGSKILDTYIAPYTATAVVLLENAGAVCIGKTNMDEFAMGSSTEYSAYGPSKNPYDPSLVPGGSSGGSAVAVATGCAVFALGSDTGGSVRQPAAFCGVVGTKNTYGRISRYGVIALASSLDTVSPFTRSVKDAAIVDTHIAGPDPLDATTPDVSVDAYHAHLAKPYSLQGVKVGISKDYLEAEGIDSEVQRVVRETIDKVRAAGAHIIELSLPMTRYALAAYYIILPSEASSNLARFDGMTYGLREAGESVREVIENSREAGFGAEVKRRIMLGTFALSSGYHEAYYGRAQKVRRLVTEEFAAAFEQVDVILTPTTPTPPFAFGANSDPFAMYLADLFTIPANLAGICGLSLPAGTTQANLPIGVQLLAPQFAEDRLFQISQAVESLVKFAPPKLVV